MRGEATQVFLSDSRASDFNHWAPLPLKCRHRGSEFREDGVEFLTYWFLHSAQLLYFSFLLLMCRRHWDTLGLLSPEQQRCRTQAQRKVPSESDRQKL